MNRIISAFATFATVATLFGHAATVNAGETAKSNDIHATHAHHAHHLGVFLGAASNLDHDHTDFAVGADYEHRLPVWQARLGLGAFVEHVTAEHAETILAPMLAVHPAGGLKLLAAPGLMLTEDHHGDSASHFLLRFGAGMDFSISGFSLTPTLNLDLVEDSKALVYGMTIGKGF